MFLTVKDLKKSYGSTSNKVEVLNNKCEKTKCEVCRECNYKVYKLIIILLCLINLFLIGKNRYILTKGYK